MKRVYSISFVKELLESAGDAPPSHEILVECEVVLTKCLADLAPFESRRLPFEWRAWTWRESRGGSIMYLCLFVTSSSGMYWYSMEGEVGIYSMFFYIKKSVRSGNLFCIFWYQKIVLIFLYQKMILWYQKISTIFWYQKMNFWYRKFIFWYQKVRLIFLYQKRFPFFYIKISKNIFWYQKIFSDIKKSISDIKKSISDIKKSIFWYQKIDFLISKNIFWYQKIDFLI